MRALQPTETAMPEGTTAFATSDDALYVRAQNGSIRRAMSKEQQRAQRKEDKKLRKGLNDGRRR